MRSRLPLLLAGLLLLPACSPGGTTAGSATATPSVVRPTPEAPLPEFALCATNAVTRGADGRSRCGTAPIPEHTPGLTCLTQAPAGGAPLTLKVSYSVFAGGKNVANIQDIPNARLVREPGRLRGDMLPADTRSRRIMKHGGFPPGTYSCEWYDARGVRVGNADALVGTLPSSSIGTRGVPY